MNCELCHKQDAQTVIYRREADGSQRELYVCRACADAERAFGGTRGINVTAMEAPEPPAGNLPQQLLGKLESLLERMSSSSPEERGQAFLEADGEQKRCPACGMTLDDVQNYSMVGCAACYRAFGEVLRSLVADLQGCREYAGDPPAAGAALRKARLDALKRELREAMAREDYLKAKALREAIRRLEEDPSGGTPEGKGAPDA